MVNEFLIPFKNSPSDHAGLRNTMGYVLIDEGIVDEVDYVLINEGRNPLMISGEASKDAARYTVAAKVAKLLMRGLLKDNSEITGHVVEFSGRAGREGAGKCFCLYPESRFEGHDDSTMPEIKRGNLSNLSALGVDDILGFDFMEKPDRAFLDTHCVS
uniref:RNA helicase n=1 Tax=Lactuca sativa TaxID=4236 RepID=A0A9R1UVN4_LACSA|nr:hypothetical protein LSAT_V11C800448320 [Lactuca sativa]